MKFESLRAITSQSGVIEHIVAEQENGALLEQTGNSAADEQAKTRWRNFGKPPVDGPAVFSGTDSFQALHPNAILLGEFIVNPTFRRWWIPFRSQKEE